MRLGGGLGLLLLLVAQQKVCPWVLSAPSASTRARHAPRSGPVAGDAPRACPGPAGPASPAGKPPMPAQRQASISGLLVDAVPVRWPGLPNRATLEESVGWREGTVARGPLDTSTGSSAALPVAILPDLHWPADHSDPCGRFLSIFQGVSSPIRDPALSTVLLRTGPPRT